MTVRVMIVDDSAFFRRRIAEILSADTHIEVVGTAVNGAEAVEKVSELKPDVITMDIEMPIMDGISAVRAIMAKRPTPVLMFSTLSTDGAKATLDALDAGALDFLPKRMEDISSDKETAKRQLCARIRILGARGLKNTRNRDDTSQGNREPSAERKSISGTKVSGKKEDIQFNPKEYKLVVIGASTGGPVALQQILIRLPEGFPVPILIVQHMPASFTPAFAQRLDELCKISVKQAEDGDYINPGSAILAPGGCQMVVEKKDGRICVRVQEATEGQIYKPSVDATLTSVARNFTGKVLVIMLTGMGSDGREGTRLLKQKGSTVWAQDEATCVVYGMPMAVIDAGLADAVLSLPEIGKSLSGGG